MDENNINENNINENNTEEKNINEKIYYEGSKSSYQPSNDTRTIGNYELVLDSDSLDVYKFNKNLLITIRGTRPTSFLDLKADASLAINNLKNSQRFINDNEKLQEIIKLYPPEKYNYYMTGHSLGGAIVMLFKKMYPFIKYSVVYNSAFQPTDIIKKDKDIKKMYMDKDFLYNKGGYLFDNKNVLKYKSKNFFNWLFNRIPLKEGLSAHSLTNFEEYYGKGVNIMIKLTKSTNKNKKFKMEFFKNNKKFKTTHFGDTRYDDFTTHKDEKRKKRYYDRHKRENWNNFFSSGSLSRYILWNKPTILESLRDYINKFKLTYKKT